MVIRIGYLNAVHSDLLEIRRNWNYIICTRKHKIIGSRVNNLLVIEAWQFEAISSRLYRYNDTFASANDVFPMNNYWKINYNL